MSSVDVNLIDWHTKNLAITFCIDKDNDQQLPQCCIQRKVPDETMLHYIALQWSKQQRDSMQVSTGELLTILQRKREPHLTL